MMWHLSKLKSIIGITFLCRQSFSDFVIVFITIITFSISPLVAKEEKVIEKPENTEVVSAYEKLSLSDTVMALLRTHEVKVRMPPYKRCSGAGKQGFIKIGSPELRTHRFAAYYYDLANYLNNMDIILLGKSIRDKYWEAYDPLNKKPAVERFKTIIGYHDYISPTYQVEKIKIEKNRSNLPVELLNFTGRFKTPFIVYHGIPVEKQPKGVLLAIHGRASAPDYVMGMYEKDDYTRSFGDQWLKNGYIVYAPQVNWSRGLPMQRLGYKEAGADLAKLVDIVKYISSKHSGIPLIVGGISYGATLAEMLGVISQEVKAVISICGNARGDFFIRTLNNVNNCRFISPEEEYPCDYSGADYHFYYEGIGLMLCVNLYYKD